MEKKNAVNIWGQLPEDWNDKIDPASPPETEKNNPEVPEKEPQAPPKPEQLPVVPEAPKPDQPGADPEQPKTDQTDPGGKQKGKKKRKKRGSRKADEGDQADHVKKAYEEEARQNKRDFLVVGIVLAVFLVAGIAALLIFSGNSTQKIYSLVDQGNYSLAYQKIQEYHKDGKNVDAAVYYFAERCVSDSEYKRAVAALEYLSPAAAEETDFFAELVEDMISHNKENRAREVLAFMRRHSETLRKTAEALAAKYGL